MDVGNTVGNTVGSTVDASPEDGTLSLEGIVVTDGLAVVTSSADGPGAIDAGGARVPGEMTGIDDATEPVGDGLDVRLVLLHATMNTAPASGTARRRHPIIRGRFTAPPTES